MKRPDAILLSDVHLREDTPACRIDDFQEAQWNKLLQIQMLQIEHQCPVICAGDLFHKWKPSPWLLSKAISMLPENFYTIYGQHDLPQHNLDLRHKSGIHVLVMAGVISLLKGTHFGQQPKRASMLFPDGNRKMLVWHRFVWDGQKVPWPGCEEMTAAEVLKKYKDYDVIVTGDHHKPFTFELKGRLLVNPGCMTRQAADYANHRPRVYFYYSKENKVEPFFLKADPAAVSREHLDIKEERDARIDAFVSRLSTEWEVSISFEENLARFMATNRFRKSVVELVNKSIDNG